jgi:hypothetical protein
MASGTSVPSARAVPHASRAQRRAPGQAGAGAAGSAAPWGWPAAGPAGCGSGTAQRGAGCSERGAMQQRQQGRIKAAAPGAPHRAAAGVATSNAAVHTPHTRPARMAGKQRRARLPPWRGASSTSQSRANGPRGVWWKKGGRLTVRLAGWAVQAQRPGPHLRRQGGQGAAELRRVHQLRQRLYDGVRVLRALQQRVHLPGSARRAAVGPEPPGRGRLRSVDRAHGAQRAGEPGCGPRALAPACARRLLGGGSPGSRDGAGSCRVARGGRSRQAGGRWGGGGAAAPQTPAAHLLRIVPDGLLAHEQRPGPLRHDGEDVCSGVVRLEGDQLAGHALHVVRQQDLGARRTGRVGGGGSGCELACCQTRPQRLQLSPTAAPGGWAAQRTASRAAGATAGHKKRHPPSRWLSSC